MYQKLLISAGGGIISRNQQAEKGDCATVAIGLGGTGISCLKALKKEVFTRVQSDDSSAIVTRYRHIRFLAVDTDPSSIADNGAVDTLDGNTEFFKISCPDIDGLLNNSHILMQKPSLKWFKARNTQVGGSEIRILDVKAGAGGIRQIGRLLLLQNCSAFVNRLTQIIRDAKTGLMESSNINIHIFTGLSGGTGAGIFLDVCYLTQHVLEKLGWSGISYTCGYFFLPDVNKANGVNSDYIPVNGFASMKELDYCMNFANNGGEWKQQYDGFEIHSNAPPVKLAHLISATDAQGRVRDNGYEYAMHVVADYVLEYIIKPFVSEREDTSNEGVFSIESHIANVALNIEMVRKEHGACYNYCVLGAANAYLPYREITTYLSSKIFEGFRCLARQLPTANDLETFIQENALDYRSLQRDLTANLPAVPNQDVDYRVLYDQVRGMSVSDTPPVLRAMRSAIPAIANRLDENSRAMLDSNPVLNSDAEKQYRSLSTRINAALRQLAAQSNRGPYYASHLLRSSVREDLLGRIRRYSEFNSVELRKARGQINQLEEEREAALRVFQKSNRFVRKKCAKTYFEAELKRVQQISRIRQLEAMGSLLQNVYTQLEAMHKSVYGKFEEIMKNLQATFDMNLNVLSQPVTANNNYAVRIITVQDLKHTLDQFVESMKLDTQVHDFVTAMFNHPEDWSTSEESKICEAVSRYFVSQLGDYTRKNIVDYLSTKFGTTTPSVLRDRIYNEIILDLDKRAETLFWTEAYYDINTAKPIGYLSIPNVSDEIRGAAEWYVRGKSEIKVRASWSSDRITLYRFVCGIPLFGYKGVSTYRQDYRNTQIVGSHLYEGSSGDARDSRTLLDVAPVSCLSDADYNDAVRNALRDYQKGLDLHVIRRVTVGDASEYRLCLTNHERLRTWIDNARQAVAEKETEKAERLLHEASTDEFLAPAKFRVIPCSGANGLEDLVIRDHVVGSPVYMELLRKESVLLEEVSGVRAGLTAYLGERDQIRRDINAFFNAVSSGAVFSGEDEYTFSFVPDAETGTPEVLTDINTEPYGMEVPLYSAFIAFRKLDDSYKQAISEAVKERRRRGAAYESAKRLHSSLNSANMRRQLKNAKASYPAGQYEAISGFYRNLRSRFADEGEEAE